MTESSAVLDNADKNLRHQDEQARRIARRRSIAIALSLAVMVALFYAATIVRLGANAVNKSW
jgi:hypothetical protein